MARLDRLGLAAKDVAQTGAAIGREFDFDLLASTTDLSEPQLCAALDRLTSAGLLFVRGMPPQSSYIFKHALVQDAAYGTLLRGRRQLLHSRVVATLEARSPEIVVAQSALLARHCTAAGLAEQAVAYWLKAGQQAQARSAMSEAVAQLRQGLDTLNGRTGRSRACVRRSRRARVCASVLATVQGVAKKVPLPAAAAHTERAASRQRGRLDRFASAIARAAGRGRRHRSALWR